MKRTILIAGLLLVAFYYQPAYCQIKNGDYLKNENVNKFVGTWKWQSGDTSFIIVLKKEKITIKNPSAVFHFDGLEGWHEFEVNGKIIESSLTSTKMTLTFGGQNSELTGSFFIAFEDLTMNKFGDARFDLVPGSKDKIKWELRDREFTKIIGFTVPTNIIMERVKGKP